MFQRYNRVSFGPLLACKPYLVYKENRQRTDIGHEDMDLKFCGNDCKEAPFSLDEMHPVIVKESVLSTSEALGWRNLLLVNMRNAAGAGGKLPSVKDHMLVLQVGGTAEVDFVMGALRGRKLAFPGQISILPGGTAFESHIDRAAALCIIYVRSSLVETVISQNELPKDTVLLPKFSFIDSVLSGLMLGCAAARSWNVIDSQSYIDHFAWAIAAHLVANYSSASVEKRQEKKRTLSDESMALLDNYIQAHIAHRIGVSDLARVAGYNPDYFSRIFQSTLGCSPYQYLLEKRVHAVRDALLTDARLADIALATGFCNQEHMTRTFRQFHGVSPSLFRRMSNETGAGEVLAVSGG